MTGSEAEAPRRRRALAALPNALTLARVALAPVILLVLAAGPALQGALGLGAPASPFMSVWPPIASGLLAVAALFDFLDGRLARALGVESAFGRRWDPIADKLVIAGALIGGVFVTTSMAFLVPAAVILARDALVSSLRASAPGRAAIAAPSRLAKWKTAAEFAGLIIFFAAPAIAPATAGLVWTGLALLWLAAALSAWTGLAYARASRVKPAER